MLEQLKQLLAFSLFVILNVANCVYAADEDSDVTKMPAASMNERVLNVSGDGERPVVLQLTVLTPNGSGPFPLVVMNHGADGKKKPKDNPRYHISFSAYYFLSRGYAVAMPMMRGFAGSGGQFEHHSCDFITTGLNNAKDIRAVIQYMVSQPNIDGQRIIVAGQSFGGFNTLALGTLDIPNVKGLISFAGGLQESDCTTSAQSMAVAAAYNGAHTSIPSIWFYGSNDKVFSESIWRAAYARYTAAGGAAELVAYGNFMEDSHNLLGFPEGLAIWGPKVDAFLARLGLPNQAIYPEYLPVPTPLPTAYAAIDDVGAMPASSDQGRQQYREFLKKPLPRVFLIADTGGIASMNGGFDPLGRGLLACKNQGGDCRPYAVDNDVVWVKPVAVPVPLPTHFAALEDAKAVPYINDQQRQQYQEFLTKPAPRAFLIADNGVVIVTSGGFDPLGRGLRKCKEHGIECFPYAIDNDIVWVKPSLAVVPPPTHFAALADAKAVPYINDQQRQQYLEFLTKPLPRAFLITDKGGFVASIGGIDPLGRGLRRCQERGAMCRPYVVDNDVVWVAAKAATAP